MKFDDLRQKVQTMFEHIDASDWSRLTDHFHPDVEYRRPGYEPIHGLDDLRSFYVSKRIIKSGRHHVESVFVDQEGASASVMGSFAGADRHGRALAVRFCDVYLFRDDKIVRRETFFDAPAV
jgi:ketosteroid isomerase-like protein